jgi:hypothetical protein
LNITFDLQVTRLPIDVIRDEGDLEVADTTYVSTTVETTNVNGVVEVNGGECVLKGLEKVWLWPRLY